MRRGGVLLAMAALGVGGGALFSLPRQDDFPHAKHAGLFPTCLGCHAGVPTGDTARHYTIGPEGCAECHDGTREERVEWTAPDERPDNLTFTHPHHSEEMAEAGDSALACADCHATPGAERRMEVAAAAPEACVACHAHRAESHLASGSDCLTCHRPLAGAEELPAGRIAGFPEPPGHDDPDFLLEHRDAARSGTATCAVCHARESCTRCHLNADRLAAVEELPADARVASLVEGRPGEWPEPPSHGQPDWETAHGDEARASIESCANCHAAPSCAACHAGTGAGFLAELPRPRPGGPAGVSVDAVAPPGHTPEFYTNHGAAAATELPNCASCHQETECADCHVPTTAKAGDADRGRAAPATGAGGGGSAAASGAGARESGSGVGLASAVHGGGVARAPVVPTDTVPGKTEPEGEAVRERDAGAAAGRDREPVADAGRDRPRWVPEEDGFHPIDFLMRHEAEAFAARSECSECHSDEAFCRSCHERIGMAAVSRQTSGAFHDAQPDWLIAHGRAARQNLEACTSCHRQSSCLRCHSARGGLRVSPHGPDFDPERLRGRSTMSCAICHFADQILP